MGPFGSWTGDAQGVVDAGEGDDLIRLGDRADVATGDGADTVVMTYLAEFGETSDSAVITDFTPGEDVLQLWDDRYEASAIDPSSVIQTVSADGTALLVGDPDAPYAILQGVRAPLGYDATVGGFS